jgi:hypothetical protein
MVKEGAYAWKHLYLMTRDGQRGCLLESFLSDIDFDTMRRWF